MRSSKDLQAILDELAAIMVKKHQDYGPMNIAGAPGGPMNGRSEEHTSELQSP